MYSLRVSRRIEARAAAIYRALLDPAAIARWRVPDGMTSVVHELDPVVGGRFRVSLTYDTPTEGKSGEHTDTYHGHFVSLDRDRRVVESLEFETPDPALQGRMTMTTTITEIDGGCEVIIEHDGIPDAVPAPDSETGTRMALDRLAALVEATAG